MADEVWALGGSALPESFPLLSDVRLVVHVYQPSAHSAIQEFAATTGGECDGCFDSSSYEGWG